MVHLQYTFAPSYGSVLVGPCIDETNSSYERDPCIFKKIGDSNTNPFFVSILATSDRLVSDILLHFVTARAMATGL